jgi:predicted GH43/DUF377 family glycosyl hydrolase
MKKRLAITICFLAITSILNARQKWDLGIFVKIRENPVARPDSTLEFFCPVKKELVKWQQADVFNPAAIVKDGKVYLFTRCEDNPKAAYAGRTSRIGLAVSEDGIHFNKFKEPVLYPDNDEFNQYDYPGGCEDPRIVEAADGQYVITYTAWNHKAPNLSTAISKDLFHWQKKGPAFAKAYQGKFLNKSTKSGSIITKMINGRPIVVKINGKNALDENAASDLPKGTYSVGELLFDRNNPEKVLKRTDKYILKPTLPHEMSGQYTAGTTFSEGLVCFHKKWFLYYGTADSFVGLAVSENK